MSSEVKSINLPFKFIRSALIVAELSPSLIARIMLGPVKSVSSNFSLSIVIIVAAIDLPPSYNDVTLEASNVPELILFVAVIVFLKTSFVSNVILLYFIVASVLSQTE